MFQDSVAATTPSNPNTAVGKSSLIPKDEKPGVERVLRSAGIGPGVWGGLASRVFPSPRCTDPTPSEFPSQIAGRTDGSLCPPLRPGRRWGVRSRTVPLSQARLPDLSFNNIEAIEGLDTLVNLEDLSLFNNRISKIDSLDALVKLQVLSLGNNHIGNMMNVSMGSGRGGGDHGRSSPLPPTPS